MYGRSNGCRISPWRLATLWLFAGVASATAEVRFTPTEPLLDDVVQIRITGLTPGSTNVVRAVAELGGRTWRAHAAFIADRSGAIDLSTQKAISGAYTGVEPMGLFLFMEPDKAEPAKATPLQITDPRITRFEVESDGKVFLRAELKRRLVRPGLRITSVKEQGLVGKLFEPEDKRRHAGLLVLSGSEGGISEAEAALLASRGYTTFALAYFKADGLPQELVKIPLEYLKRGLDWLAARDSVDPKRLGVVGGSKGGELALLLASRFAEIKAVVARAPSHVVWSGIGGGYNESGWTYEGKPLPFLWAKPNPAFFKQVGGKEPLRLIELYRPALDDKDAVAKALIPVEKINGAVLLISGTDDQLWPASLMADRVIERLRDNKHPHPFEHLRYESAGHAIPNAYVPIRQTIQSANLAMGGTPAANARALMDSRPKVIRFLNDRLKAR